VYHNDTKYYPQFPIIEKGGRSIAGNEVKIKVMRAVLSFWRSIRDLITIDTVEGETFKEILILTKIHQRVRGKKRTHPPLLVYLLSKYGFRDTLDKIGFHKNELVLVDEVKPSDKHYHISVGNNVYIRIEKTSMGELIKRRFVASYISILKFRKKFSIEELVEYPSFYITALGAYTYPSTNKYDIRLLYSNAMAHLENCNTILDLPTRRQLVNIGINVENIYELILIIFKEIDLWVSSYIPTDMYSKKIGSLTQLLSSFTEQVFTKQFQLISNKRKQLEQNNMSSFANTASKQLGWYTDNQIFKANPSIYNDNWLLAIGAKRFRSLNNIEIRTRDKERSSKIDKRPPMKMVTAHPSQLVVESVIAIPSSTPIMSGTINPYLQIDNDGNIIKPEWAHELDTVFDKS
jgi:hypothetical protein